MLAALFAVSALVAGPGPADSLTVDPAWIQYEHTAWATIGRAALSAGAGLQWDSVASNWSLASDWKGADNIGDLAYELEPHIRGHLAMAVATNDRSAIEEIAKFYTAFLNRFTTVAQIHTEAIQAGRGMSKVLPQGPPTARTLNWHDPAAKQGFLPAECILCNSQILHPAARLVRIIAQLPTAERTQPMQDFVRDYVPLLTRDHLVRVVFETRFPQYVKGRAPDDHLMPLWQNAIPQPDKYHFLDRDLWLIGAAAELLEAHRLDPALVHFEGEQARVEQIVTVGIKLLLANRQHHAGTKNFQGQVVGSDGYFELAVDTRADSRYSGYSGPDFPAGKPEQRGHGVSWDISHLQRLPVVLRSLWDSRTSLRALGVTYPDSNDIVQAANQLLYRVFNGDYDQPSLTNYFDGSDGWYRVAYRGREGYGTPPSKYCNGADAQHACLSRNGVRGWGMLAFAQPDLAHLIHRVIDLSRDRSPEIGAFRDRVYAASTDPYKWIADPPGRYSHELRELIGEFALGTHP